MSFNSHQVQLDDQLSNQNFISPITLMSHNFLFWDNSRITSENNEKTTFGWTH